MYHGTLTLDLPEAIIGYVDNNEVIVVVRLLDEIEVYVNETAYDIKLWLGNACLSLTGRKLELVLS